MLYDFVRNPMNKIIIFLTWSQSLPEFSYIFALVLFVTSDF